VINQLKDARHVFGDVPLHAVMGGFHLSGSQIEEIIPDAVNDMKGFGLKHVVPAHRTGWRAVGTLEKELGEEVIVLSAVGRKFVS
jgi:7,8-dihydropterin-6-yl-methyl-4-(beta-D-ribofuranosyl)aminobenzene 5'-phosphate synthase